MAFLFVLSIERIELLCILRLRIYTLSKQAIQLVKIFFGDNSIHLTFCLLQSDPYFDNIFWSRLNALKHYVLTAFIALFFH